MLPPEPQLPEIEISPPRCYRSISPQLTCLGYLRNLTDADLADISVRARFSGAALPVDLRITPLEAAAGIRHQVIALAQAAAQPTELHLNQ